MPNKRSKFKRGISVYVYEDVKKALAAEAERLDVPMSTLIDRIYRDALEQRGYKLNKSYKEKSNNENR